MPALSFEVPNRISYLTLNSPQVHTRSTRNGGTSRLTGVIFWSGGAKEGHPPSWKSAGAISGGTSYSGEASEPRQLR